jgi:hypothetical protein
VVVLLLAWVMAGCGGPGRVLLDVPVWGAATGPLVFDVEGGEVALDRAEVTFSDLRLEEPATDGATARLARAVWPAAWAHPGHDYPGDVAGELLGTYTIDLSAPEVELGVAACYDGAYATGRVALSGTAAVLEGTFTPDGGAAAPFRFEVAAEQEIVDLPFAVTMDAASPPAAVGVGFDPEAALAFVDWSAPDTDGDGVLTTADAIYDTTVVFGVVSTATWSLEGRE